MFTNKDIGVFDNKIDDLEDSAEILTDKVNEELSEFKTCPLC